MSARLRGHDTRSGPAFKLDRLELVDGGRYEVEGQWSGVRGRRFIRPELTLTNRNQSQRLLADLAQKPWQTADGETWTVGFPCADDPIDATEVELTVAPDITVTVKRGRAKASPKPTAPAETEAKAAGKRRGLGVQLAEAQRELEQLRDERARLSDRLAAATRRAEEARAEREHVAQSRDQLADQLDRAVAERDTATRLAAVDQEAAQHTKDELEQARNALEQALETLNQTAVERDSAIRAGVEVERELHAVKAEREDLINDRERLVSQQNWLKGELKRISAECDPAARGEPEQARPPARPSLVVSRPLPLPPSGPDEWVLDGGGRFSTGSRQYSRAVALAALAAAIVAVVLVLLLLVF